MFLAITLGYAWLEGVSGPRGWLLIGLVSVWSLRLSYYITARNHGEPEDHRYQKIDHALGNIGKIRHLPERFPCGHGRQMYFNKRNLYGQQGIPQRNTAVRVGGRIEDDVVDPITTGLLNRIDQFAFRVALQAVKRQAAGRSQLSQILFDRSCAWPSLLPCATCW